MFYNKTPHKQTFFQSLGDQVKQAPLFDEEDEVIIPNPEAFADSFLNLEFGNNKNDQLISLPLDGSLTTEPTNTDEQNILFHTTPPLSLSALDEEANGLVNNQNDGSAISSRHSSLSEIIYQPNVYKAKQSFSSFDNSLEKSLENSFVNLTFDFIGVLVTRSSEQILAFWNEHPILHHWYSSKLVQFTNEDQPRSIEFTELNSIFMRILSSKCLTLLHFIWKENATLQSWYMSKPHYFNNEKEPSYIAFDDLNDAFTLMLLSKYHDLIKLVWYENARLQEYYSHHQEFLNKLHFDSLLKLFRAVLCSQHSELMILIWDTNPCLQAWYGQKTICVDNEEKNISDKELQSAFIGTLVSQCPKIITFFWGRVQETYLNLDPTIEENLNELLLIFNIALSNRCIMIVEALWNAHQPLRRSFKDNDSFLFFMDVLDSQMFHYIEITWRHLAIQKKCLHPDTNENLIYLFKKVLFSRQEYILDFILSHNLSLQIVLKNSPWEEFKPLLELVLAYTSRNFVEKYLKFLNNIKFVKNFIKEKNENSLTQENKNLDVLYDYLRLSNKKRKKYSRDDLSAGIFKLPKTTFSDATPSLALTNLATVQGSESTQQLNRNPIIK